MTFQPAAEHAHALRGGATGGESALAPADIAWGASLVCFAAALTATGLLRDGDTFWHIRAGEWILAHGAVPRTDPFSFTFAGQPWTAHEWLSEVFLALAYRLAGWSGVLLLTAGAFAGAALTLVRALGRSLAGPALILLAAAGLGLQVGAILARPHSLVLPLVALWAAMLIRARDEDRAPSLAFAPAMTLWANMHGSFVFGLALIGCFALEALLAARPGQRRRVLLGWGGFGLACVGAALVNPVGAEALLFPFKLMRLQSLSAVIEWRPVPFADTGVFELELLGLIGLLYLRPLKLPVARALLLIGLTHLALHHARHLPILGLIAPMSLARPLAESLGAAPVVTKSRAALIFAALAVLAAGARLATPLRNEFGPMAPFAAIAAVPEATRATPALNSYDFGGALIFSGIKPYIDGRTDLYGDAFMARYRRIAAGDPASLDAELAARGIGWTLFRPGEKIVAALDARPGWKRLYSDDVAVIHVRADGPR
jgi:hypothetical protein